MQIGRKIRYWVIALATLAGGVSSLYAAAPKVQETPALAIGTKPEALEPKMQNRGFVAALGSIAACLGRETLQLVVMPRRHDQQRRRALVVRPKQAMGELHQKKLIALPVGELSVPSRIKGAFLRQEMVYRDKDSKNARPLAVIMAPPVGHRGLSVRGEQKGSIFYASHYGCIGLPFWPRQDSSIFPVRDKYAAPEAPSGSDQACQDEALGVFLPAGLPQGVAKVSRRAPGWSRAGGNMPVNGGLNQQRCFSIAIGAGRTFPALEFHSPGFDATGIATAMHKSAMQGALAMEKQSQDQQKASSELNRPYK